ncbi:MAG: C-terminal binding protein [Halolamina sp.]
MTYTVALSDDKTVDSNHQTEILEAIGAEVTTLDEKTEAAVAAAARDADALIVDAGTPVTAAVFDGAGALQVVGRSGIGVDNIDIDAAAANGVTVVNVPTYSLDEVSTHAFSLLLACVRAVPQYDRAVKDGTWDWKTGQPLRRMAGRTLGLVGFGSIARRLAAKLRSFGVEVVATDPYVGAATMRDYDVENVSFGTLLDRADYVSVHVPLYEDTRHLFSTAAFERLSDDCLFVNTSRGPVVDEAALVDALERGEIRRAGLDVLESEPPAADSPLLDRDDVVLTPHAAWYSEESRDDLSEGVASGVAAVLRGEDHEGVIDPETPWV